MARSAPINVIAAFHTSDDVKGARQKLARAGVRKSDVRTVEFRYDSKSKVGDTLISVSVKDEDTALKARKALEEAGAERVDAVDANGTPLPSQAEPE